MSEVSHLYTKKSIMRMNKRGEKWRHSRASVEIAWMSKKQVWSGCDVIWSCYKSWRSKNIAGQVLPYNSKNLHWLNTKLDVARTMSELKKPFQKTSEQKNKKKTKSKSKCRMWTKTTSEKAKFRSNTVFSHYFKFIAKKFCAVKPLAFSLHFLFQRDQNHYNYLN